MADADRSGGFVLGKHQHLVWLAVRDQKWRVGGNQHFLRKLTITRQTLTQASDETGAPVRVEVRLGLIEQEQAVGVPKQQA
ncbi:hypothetical protein D9M72_622240 [compost metagenome]